MRRTLNPAALARLGEPHSIPTVLDALARRDARLKAGPRPAVMPAATARGRRAPKGKTPAKPAPQPAAPTPPAPKLEWAVVEDTEDGAWTPGAYECLDLAVPPWAAAPVSAPVLPAPAPVPPVVVEPAHAEAVAGPVKGPRVLRLDAGFRVEELSAILGLVLVFHAATWVGAMVGFGGFLPLPVAIGIPTLTVWGGLALIGGLGKSSLGWVRRAAIVAFTVVNVYGSFYAWNDLLAGSGAETEMARAAHRELRAEVFTPLETAAGDAERAAVAAERKCEDESSQKRGGYGARARQLCDAARDLRAAADAAATKRDALAPYFTDDVFALPPTEMWDRAALAAGVADVPAPPRESYYAVPLLRALNDLADGRMAAVIALVFALCIDLAGIGLGRGLHRH